MSCLKLLGVYSKTRQESPAVARENALRPIQFLLQY